MGSVALTKVERATPRTSLGVELRPTGRRWQGNDGECDTFLFSGIPLTDSVLAPLNVPGHEACVEVDLQRGEG
ncbi:hypothetical protein GCM10025331_05970 [Actinoplanes utahensis]|nr:hypothetical protein Aut01nite_13230 [Actinoplanes utahensis]